MTHERNEAEAKKPWYKTVLGILFIIFTFPLTLPPVLLYVIWAKSKQDKTVKIILTAVIAIITLVIWIPALSENETQKTPEIWTTESTDEKENPLPQDPSLPEFEKEETKIDKLWTLVDSVFKTRKGYDVEYVENNKTVVITYYSNDHWNEQGAVNAAFDDFINYTQKALTLDDIDYVTLQYQGDFTDQYGKKEKENAVLITFTREAFQKFDWTNLKGFKVYDGMLREAELIYIHPAIRKNIDTSKIVY